MSDSLDEMNARLAAARNKAAQKDKQPQQGLRLPRPPAYGYEQSRAEMLRGTGGTTIDGRRSRPKERINDGPYKGKTPGQAINAHRSDYARSSMADKAKATGRAEGRDIRTPYEVNRTDKYDTAMSQAIFGPMGQGSSTGRGNRGASASAAPSASARAPGSTPYSMPGEPGPNNSSRFRPDGSPVSGGAAAPMTSAESSRSPVRKPMGYDGTLNTPQITADQFRQANAPVTSVAQAKARGTGKSERVPYRPASAAPSASASAPGSTPYSMRGQPMTSSEPSESPVRKPMGYDGTLNTPQITADQFRQANAPVTSVAQAKAGGTGKSERVPYRPGGGLSEMTVGDTSGGGRTVAGAYGAGSSRQAARRPQP